MHALLTLPLALLPFAANADVTARFIEGAPKDQFVIAATTCPLADATVTLDLSTAPAGLIFDVTASGAGVEVFQPVEVVSGTVRMNGVTDGDQVLTMALDSLGAEAAVIISADIDDTLANGTSGQIIVSGSEIAGASVVVETEGESYRGTFDNTGYATVRTPACLS